MKTERRAVARYREKLSVQIDMDDYRFDAATTEISLQGLRILCAGPVAKSVFNRYIQVTPGENVTASVQIKIPKSNDSIDILESQTKVITVNRVSQESYIVGFKITEFDEEDQEKWHKYISTKI